MRGEGRGQINQLFAVFVVEFLFLGVDLEDLTSFDRILLLEQRIAVVAEDRFTVFVQLFNPVLEVEADTAGHADSGQEDRRDAVGASDNRCDVHERHVRRCLLTSPQRDVVHARHTRRTHAHRALFSDHHDALARVLEFQLFDVFLCSFIAHAFAVQFAVSARVCLVTRRQKVGRNVALSSNKGHDFDFFFDLRQTGEEFSVCVALQNVGRNSVASRMSRFQTISVSLVEEHLGFQNFCCGFSNCLIIAEREVEQNLNRRSALHVRQQFKRECGVDLGNGCLTKDDLFEELSLHASGARGAGERVVDEVFQGIGAVRVVDVLDLLDDFGSQSAIIDRLGAKPLRFAGFDLFEVAGIEAHWYLRWKTIYFMSARRRKTDPAPYCAQLYTNQIADAR